MVSMLPFRHDLDDPPGYVAGAEGEGGDLGRAVLQAWVALNTGRELPLIQRWWRTCACVSVRVFFCGGVLKFVFSLIAQKYLFFLGSNASSMCNMVKFVRCFLSPNCIFNVIFLNAELLNY